MTRRSITALSLLSLLAAASFVCSAETLYQWQESDGSLTFSPTPPPEGSGIQYKTLGSITASEIRSEKVQAGVTAPESKPADRKFLPSPSTQMNPSGSIGTLPLSASAKFAGQTTYEPISKPKNVQGIASSVGHKNPSFVASPTRSAGKATGNPMINMDRKSRQCTGLKKRIVSLEHIMANSDQPETMDKAVVQISRYQHNFNRHCTDVKLEW